MTRHERALMIAGISTFSLGMNGSFDIPVFLSDDSTPLKHWKETQSEEDKNDKLAKAEAKRLRKAIKAGLLNKDGSVKE